MLRVATWLQFNPPGRRCRTPLRFCWLSPWFLSRSELRWEFASFAAAVVLLFIALAAIALFFFRHGTRDLTLIYFSAFCTLYVVRLLASLRYFQTLFDASTIFWSYVSWVPSNILISPASSSFTNLLANASKSSFAGFSPHERWSRFASYLLPRLESVRQERCSRRVRQVTVQTISANTARYSRTFRQHSPRTRSPFFS